MKDGSVIWADTIVITGGGPYPVKLNIANGSEYGSIEARNVESIWDSQTEDNLNISLE